MLKPLEPRCPHKSKMWNYLTLFGRNKAKESVLHYQQNKTTQLVKGGDDGTHERFT